MHEQIIVPLLQGFNELNLSLSFDYLSLSVSVYRRDRTQGRSRLVRYLEFILSMAFTIQHEPQKKQSTSFLSLNSERKCCHFNLRFQNQVNVNLSC